MSRDKSLFGAIREAMPDGAQAFLHLSSGNTITYADLLVRSGQFAHSLAASGVKPGDRVAVQVEKSANALLLYMACLRAGAVYLPLNPAYTLTEVEYFLADAEPVLVVVQSARENQVRELVGDRAGVLTLSDDGNEVSLIALADTQPSDFDNIPRAADDLAAIL